MKKTFVLILLFLSVNTIAFAQTPKELFDTGVASFKQGLYQNAIDQFSKVIELSPEHADAYKNRGVCYMQQKKYALAIKDFEKAKSIFPELKGLYSNLGVAWHFTQEYQKAVDNYDIEIKMSPENPLVYFNRALSLVKLEKNKEALQDLEKTLNINPDFYWAICYKADLLALEGKTQEAIKTYEKAIKQDSQNTYAIEKLNQLKKDHPSPGAPSYTVQAGAFLSKSNAIRFREKLINDGFDARVLVMENDKNQTWHIVRVGNYTKRSDAKLTKQQLKEKLNISGVVRKSGRW